MTQVKLGIMKINRISTLPFQGGRGDGKGGEGWKEL